MSQIVKYKDNDFELDDKEWNLILAIRNKYPYGEVIIQTRDGHPHRITRTVVYDQLDIKNNL